MDFKMMQFMAYTETLRKLNNETNDKKRNELTKELNLLRKGLLPISMEVIDGNQKKYN